jgi:hypothetical protein
VTSEQYPKGLIRPPLLLSDRQRGMLRTMADRLRPDQRTAFTAAVQTKLFGRPTDTAVITAATQVQRMIKSGDRLVAAGR